MLTLPPPLQNNGLFASLYKRLQRIVERPVFEKRRLVAVERSSAEDLDQESEVGLVQDWVDGFNKRSEIVDEILSERRT